MPKGSRFPETRQYLALNLKYTRTMLGITQEQLAEMAELDRTQIGAIERQQSGASVDSVGLMGKALHVPPYTLLMPPEQAQPAILSAIQPQLQKAAIDRQSGKKDLASGKKKKPLL